MGEKPSRPLIYLVFFFILLFVYSKWGPTLPISVVTQERGQPLVVEGTGTELATPDSAKIGLGIEETGISLSDAQKLSSQKSKLLVDSLKERGVDEKDIKTTGYNIYPDYDYSQGRAPKIIGYRVSISYEVTVKDIEKVNDILAMVTQNGANIVGNVSFEVSTETKNKILDEARKKAADEARKKAESLAKATGVTLGKVLSISEYSNNGYPVPLLEKAGVGGDIKSIPPEITPGQAEISVTVSISFEIR